ncbi:histidine phosphatase family protein [Streptomyces purpurogeneiscleroticus]|uniref:histidine phosphatase family protein n=1 Tax=Streptomyces purpurogeneiscleroticus TaxID=68259 RepID=UPI001CBC6163|nr:histidine phosphatase family protein [Streptomyces purpurogeneiscleroticus]MBZ4014614.1 histidine phosphatase family protein [Streptomyces purpurogeneiscleroticus]
MTDFLLVRHGETVWHAENRYAGRTDVALTERGHAQAAELAAWAAGAGIDAVVCSPLSRARLTAEPAARALGLAPRVDARLLEVDFGRGDGLTRTEMREVFPERLDAFLRDPVVHHLPGGEDPEEAAARAADCLADLARELPDGRVLVVAHSTLVRLLLCRVLGIPLGTYRTVFPVLDNGALTELRLKDGRASLLRLNAPCALSPSGTH